MRWAERSAAARCGHHAPAEDGDAADQQRRAGDEGRQRQLQHRGAEHGDEHDAKRGERAVVDEQAESLVPAEGLGGDGENDEDAA